MIHSHQTIWLTNLFLEYWYITLTYSGYSHGVSQTYHNAHGTTCPTWQAHLANFVFRQGHLHRNDSSSGSDKGADDEEQWTSRVHDHPPVGMIAWTSATATCTWNVGSLRTIAHPSRPWKPMLPRVWTLPWAPWTCCSTISSDKWTRWWTIPWWPRVETPTSTGPTWRCYSAMDVMPRQPG